MADTGWVSPGTVVSDGSGPGNNSVSWSDPNNSKLDDASYSVAGGAADCYEFSFRIINSDGSYGSTNKAILTDWQTTESYSLYGSSSDLWGETISDADTNNSSFGLAFAIDTFFSIQVETEHLKATNFSFSVPSGATIDGIEVRVKRLHDTGANEAKVNHIQMKVYYTESTPTSSPKRLSLLGVG